jgi:four helix bundle protein
MGRRYTSRMTDQKRGHRDLVAWQLGMDLAASVYDLVKVLPDSERFGLRTQLTRAAGSVPANIAEGYGLTTKLQFRRHLYIANGSLKELETHLELGVRVGLLVRSSVAPALDIARRLGAVLRGLTRSLS